MESCAAERKWMQEWYRCNVDAIWDYMFIRFYRMMDTDTMSYRHLKTTEMNFGCGRQLTLVYKMPKLTSASFLEVAFESCKNCLLLRFVKLLLLPCWNIVSSTWVLSFLGLGFGRGRGSWWERRCLDAQLPDPGHESTHQEQKQRMNCPVYSPAVYISLSANWHQLQMLWELEKAKHIFAAEEVTKGITACTIKRSCCTWCGFHSDFCIDLKDSTCDSCNARTLPPRLIYIGTEIVKVRNPQERSERQGDEWRLIKER